MTGRVLPPKGTIWAAGGVVWRRTKKGKHRYLLVYRPRYDDWSLPKGKLDKGEKFRDAAVREVAEETSVKAKPGSYIGTIFYETSNGNPKIVRYWLMETKNAAKFTENAEVSAIAWLSASKARARLTYERDRMVLDRGDELATSPRSSRIFLVRHAHAGSRGAWDGPDRLRPTSKRGKKESTAIQDFLAQSPVSRIASSPYLRCRQTVEPIAKSLGEPLENEKALLEGASVDQLIAFIREASGESIVMCSHGDVIGNLVGHLAAENVPLEGPLEWEKSSIWVLDAVDGSIRSGRYVAPLL